MPACSIIIPVHNRASLTRQCLNILLARPLLGDDVEIIVVDDASTDITPSILGSYGDRIRTVRHQQNLGFASACNDAAHLSSGEFLIFLHNDTMPQPGWLDALVSYAYEHPKAAAVAGKLLFPNDTTEHCGITISQDKRPRHLYVGFPADHPAVNKSRRFQIVTAACMLVPHQQFEALGGFDTAFTHGYEDVDFCLRLGELGHEVHYCHESVLYHLNGLSEGRLGSEGQDAKLYMSRWGPRVKPDDLFYHLEDGLLKVDYPEVYPVSYSISPLLAAVNATERDQLADRLLQQRSHQIYQLLQENIRLSIRLQELEEQKTPSPMRQIDGTGFAEFKS